MTLPVVSTSLPADSTCTPAMQTGLGKVRDAAAEPFRALLQTPPSKGSPTIFDVLSNESDPPGSPVGCAGGDTAGGAAGGVLGGEVGEAGGGGMGCGAAAGAAVGTAGGGAVGAAVGAAVGVAGGGAAGSGAAGAAPPALVLAPCGAVDVVAGLAPAPSGPPGTNSMYMLWIEARCRPWFLTWYA